MVCASLVIFCTEVVILQISPLKQQYIHQHNLTIPHSVKIAFNTILSPSTTPAAQFTYNSWRLKLCHQKFSDNIYIYISFFFLLSCASGNPWVLHFDKLRIDFNQPPKKCTNTCFCSREELHNVKQSFPRECRWRDCSTVRAPYSAWNTSIHRCNTTPVFKDTEVLH